MRELIRMIPGPIFLLIYASIFILITPLSNLLIKIFTSKNNDISFQLTAVQLGYIRGGYAGVLDVVLISLLIKKIIKIEKGIVYDLGLNNDVRIDELEEEVLKCIGEYTSYSYLKNSKVLMGRIENQISQDIQKLKYANLLGAQGLKILLVFFNVILLTLGLYKLYLGYIYNKPSMILIFFLLITIIKLFFGDDIRKTKNPLGKSKLDLYRKVAISKSQLIKDVEDTSFDKADGKEYKLAMAIYGFNSISKVIELEVARSNYGVDDNIDGDYSYCDGDFGSDSGGDSDGGSDSGCGGCGGCGGE